MQSALYQTFIKLADRLGRTLWAVERIMDIVYLTLGTALLVFLMVAARRSLAG